MLAARITANRTAARHVAAPATIRSLGRTSRSNPPRGGPRHHLYGPVVQLFHPAGPAGGTTTPTVSKAPTATAATARRNPRQLVAHLDDVYNHYARLPSSAGDETATASDATRSSSRPASSSKSASAPPPGLPQSFTVGWTQVEPTADERKLVDLHLARLANLPEWATGALGGKPQHRHATDLKPTRKRKSAVQKQADAAAAAAAAEESEGREKPSADSVAAASEKTAKDPKGSDSQKASRSDDAQLEERFYRTPSGKLALVKTRKDDPESSPEISIFDTSDSVTTPSSSAADTDERAEVSAILSDFLGQRVGEPAAAAARANHKVVEPLFEKSNILLLGPTGTGKSLLARTLARQLEVPFVSVDAASWTAAGYVGGDVEECIARLAEAADGDLEKAARGIVFIDEVDKIAATSGTTRDIGGTGVQQALLKMLEGTTVNVSEHGYSGGSGGGAASMFGGFGRRGPSREPAMVDTTNILFICAGAFVGLDKIVQARLSKGSIGFTSRIAPAPAAPASEPSTGAASATTLLPPVAQPTRSAPTVSRAGQVDSPPQDLSPLLEQVEPQDLVQFGLIPEFIGRIPITAALKALSEGDLIRILKEPKFSLVQQYTDLFAASGVHLLFTSLALKAVAAQAVKKQTGARGLRRIMENVLLDSMYEAPQSSIRYVLITEAVVTSGEPARYYSRSQKHLFEIDHTAEEESVAAAAAAESGAPEAEAEAAPAPEHAKPKKRAAGF
ncbi:hypothetical protein C6P46_003032 [Rhodotorula mucilaginosa]|uniref:Uncharacterized protein n=1 Tax=Rhodotorula mucilaginosa TaxID=5537 RepID=A0A9P7B7H1_RHOMI|nr:hypothetical protein C6P46_003032 [Rhodotorula mucilaginosa]